MTTVPENPLCIDFLTVTDVAPPQLVDAAAACGVSHISVLITPAAGGLDYQLIGDTPARRDTRQRCRDTGVAVDMAEGFMLVPETRVENYQAALESAAWLGAGLANLMCRDPDRPRVLDNLARFAELSASFNIQPVFEFMAISDLTSMADAMDAIAKSGARNVTVLVDILHVVRSGGSIDELRRMPVPMLGRAQIADGALSVPAAEQRFEALQQRGIPGQGEFPLVDFVRALPPGVMLGIEAPLKDLKDAGVPAAERVRRLVEATRRVMAQAAQAAA